MVLCVGRGSAEGDRRVGISDGQSGIREGAGREHDSGNTSGHDMYPRLSVHGILILDDYGHYRGRSRRLTIVLIELQKIHCLIASIIHAESQ